MPPTNEQIVLQRIQSEIDRFLLEHDAPEEVLGFLHQHWARLLTGIFMAKGNQHADWLAGWDTVNALLWSLAPKDSRAETQKMLQMLPTLLARLHEGCATLSIPVAERDAMFSRLAMMHAAVARAGLHCQDGSEKGITNIAQTMLPEEMIDLGALSAARVEPVQLSPSPDSGAAMPMPELKIGDGDVSNRAQRQEPCFSTGSARPAACICSAMIRVWMRSP